MPNSLAEIITAICAALSAIGTLYVLISNTKTKNAIAQRDAETKNKLDLLRAEQGVTGKRVERAELAATNATTAALDAKEAAVTARTEVKESREERKEQFTDLRTVNLEARDTANGHNAKIAELTAKIEKQQSEILSLRRLQESRDAAQMSPQPQV